jgi:hypothetical protein
VVLELGDNVGAVILTTPAALVGAEIEVRPAHGQWTGTHVAVLRRNVQGGPMYAATFASLPAGHYQLRIRNDDNGPVVPALVNGGRVETTAWPDA